MLTGQDSPWRQGFGLSLFSFPSFCHISMNSWFLSLAGKRTARRRISMYTLQLPLQKPKPQLGPLAHSPHMKFQLSCFLADTVHFFLSFNFQPICIVISKNTVWPACVTDASIPRAPDHIPASCQDNRRWPTAWASATRRGDPEGTPGLMLRPASTLTVAIWRGNQWKEEPPLS